MKLTKIVTLIKFELEKQLISTFLTYNNCIALGILNYSITSKSMKTTT